MQFDLPSHALAAARHVLYHTWGPGPDRDLLDLITVRRNFYHVVTGALRRSDAARARDAFRVAAALLDVASRQNHGTPMAGIAWRHLSLARSMPDLDPPAHRAVYEAAAEVIEGALSDLDRNPNPVLTPIGHLYGPDRRLSFCDEAELAAHVMSILTGENYARIYIRETCLWTISRCNGIETYRPVLAALTRDELAREAFERFPGWEQALASTGWKVERIKPVLA